MNTINLDSVGLGLWDKNALRLSSNIKNARLATICDSNPDELKKYSALYPSAKIYNDYSEVLNSDEINAVLLATPAPVLL
jgi:predicted dehydrogenase